MVYQELAKVLISREFLNGTYNNIY